MISALTPICFTLIGGVIGMAVLIRGGSDAGLGLASTAIAGAAGLAQPQQEKQKDE